MEVVYPCCCGLAVYKKSITACVLWAEAKGKSRKEKRRFGTFTHDLLQLANWLRESGVTHVAMESTGVYWKPVWNILAEQFKVLLVNAQHIKAVPGRKTDQKLPRSNPCCSKSAIHSLSFWSVFRPGTALMCCAFTNNTLNCSARMFHTGFQYTPVDSMAAWVTPHSPSQSASCNKS